jgi:hypothetical protein
MSTDLVNNEIKNFLERKTPEVLSIQGKWGVGKTYTWTKQLKDAVSSQKSGLLRYSYVSLFGINSLDELKFSIFENTVTLSGGNIKADLNTLGSFLNQNQDSWRRITRFAQSMPVLKSFFGSEAPALLSFLTVRDQIICIDDLERRGQKLDVGDVLGLASSLREQRECKIVFLLNDEQLAKEQKEKFDSYLEKVVDISLTFDPTPQDSASVALNHDDHVSQRISELCISLGISNIRVIKKIERYIQLIMPSIQKFEPMVFNQVTSSLALFVWSKYQPGEAPTLEFLTTKKAMAAFGLHKKEDLSNKEAAWNALLDSYGYAWTDDFDLTLIDGVINGYFDLKKIEKQAGDLNKKTILIKAEGSFSDAWRAFHDSFDDNQNQVLDMIYSSFMESFKSITPLNLSGTVSFFKELGQTEQASEMIRHYVENRNESREFFNLEDYVFSNDITDEEMKQAFKIKFMESNIHQDISAMLLKLSDGWNDEVISILSSTPVENYRRIFKETRGKDLRKMLAGALQFDRMTEGSSKMNEISKKAKQALQMIGSESAINSRRVARFGVTIENRNSENTYKSGTEHHSS